MSSEIEILELYLSAGHDFKGRFGKTRLHHEVERVSRVECVAGKGLVGDRYFGYKEDFKGQLSLISLEAIREVEQAVGIEVEDRSLFRRNAVVQGVDLKQLVGRRFRLGDVLLEGSEQCKPCFWMDEAIAEGAFAAMEDRGGLRCRIVESGELALGSCELKILG